jgi:diguanylate cyclase (GGDEF)-like protein
VEKNSPDLILLDILMPEMDGFETYSALRRYEDEAGKPHIPVIFLTGESGAEIERRGLKIGASDFIRKPFNRDVLLRRIHNTIINSKTIESLTEEATVDKLTGFLNKSSGTNRVSKLCESSTGALVIMDLDSFKLVNDLFGHDMGDRMLQAFSDIVRRNVRESDVVSRIGGDEFLAFFANVTRNGAIESFADRVNRQIREEAAALMGADHGIPIGISIGVAIAGRHGMEFEPLFALADGELYKVKRNGKQGYSVYKDTETDEKAAGDDLNQEIERITKIVAERNEKEGALLYGRESFSIAYQFIIRYYKSYGGSAVQLLFVLLPGDTVDDLALPDICSLFGNVLRRSLRRSDLILQSRSNQFFVFLTERSTFEAKSVVDRIMTAWEKEGFGNRVRIRYAFQSVSYSEDEKD